MCAASCPPSRAPWWACGYFNVFGPREHHKGRMMSVLHQLLRQLREAGACRLFRGTDGFGDGEQRRDFIYVGDIVSINLHFGGGDMVKGIMNAGRGSSVSFNDIARAPISISAMAASTTFPSPTNYAGNTRASPRRTCAACARRVTPPPSPKWKLASPRRWRRSSRSSPDQTCRSRITRVTSSTKGTG